MSNSQEASLGLVLNERISSPPPMENIFEQVESHVRSYGKTFPRTFAKAQGSLMWDTTGQMYIDFFCGAGALNYGHNPRFAKEELLRFLENDEILHALDMQTSRKERFLESFHQHILKPRRMDNWKVQFCGPTGANAVEAALKLARKVTGRSTIIAFNGAFHGMSLGALAVTGDHYHRRAAGVSLDNVVFVPYPQGPHGPFDSLALIQRYLEDPLSGVEKPAAILIEPVQAEGGVFPAGAEFLQELSLLCKRHGILLIADEIQVGCGRTGPFFAFESAGILPDMVLLSKSIGGYGFPMSLVLIKSEYDVWKKGEHNGTFRGNQIAFVSAHAALERHWQNDSFTKATLLKNQFATSYLKTHLRSDVPIVIRSAGLMIGIDLSALPLSSPASAVTKKAFARGVLVEATGRFDTVVKVLPALTIEEEWLEKGLKVIVDAIASL